MKRDLTRYFLALCLAGLALLAGATALAQTGGGYDLAWNVLGAGGGAAAGGGYALQGTVGQPAPGTLSGGPYTLNGGFWPGASTSGRVYLPSLRR